MRIFITFLALSILLACQPETTSKQIEGNPPAEGFNAAASDTEAINLADRVMEAMGGRNAWENTRHLTWNFFGRRTLYWDKSTGDVRLEIPQDSIVALVNINTGTGKVAKAGREIVEDEPKAYWLKRTKSIWINDSYWLVMPFKLKDSGVTLKYMGKDTMDSGRASEKLALTFENVGDTPENKYVLHVGEDKLIHQWDFYSNANDSIARFKTPWNNYTKYDDILLSGDRGKNQLTDIAVYETLPSSVYQVFEPVQLKE